MFWISYCVTFVLASAIAIALAAIRLLIATVGLIPPPHHGKVARGWGVIAGFHRSGCRQSYFEPISKGTRQ